MHTWTCDGCKKEVHPPVYAIRTIFNERSDINSTEREQHFHWDCLKKYVKEA